jgi:hypothetical protein
VVVQNVVKKIIIKIITARFNYLAVIIVYKMTNKQIIKKLLSSCVVVFNNEERDILHKENTAAVIIHQNIKFASEILGINNILSIKNLCKGIVFYNVKNGVTQWTSQPDEYFLHEDLEHEIKLNTLVNQDLILSYSEFLILLNLYNKKQESNDLDEIINNIKFNETTQFEKKLKIHKIYHDLRL